MKQKNRMKNLSLIKIMNYKSKEIGSESIVKGMILFLYR